ncbi:MAG TPA: DUF1634 domain-containing protein [Anaeromyxobacteraceae bacterium]|nr:DUF1634 domain-containing protein [Anaeromyxobacteraceae bacterium]
MSAWTDQRMERIIGRLLQTGVLLSTVLVLAGAVVELSGHASQVPDYRVFRGEPPALRGFAGIARQALALHGRGLIQFGLLVLIATPVARVAFSVFAFLAEHDLTYVVVTLVVLAVLAFSLFGAHP